MSDSVSIRAAVPEDAAALLAIYAPYVEHTAITFEYDVPSLSEFRGRIEKTLARYPYLVAEIDEKPVGYAYAGPLKDRRAYDYCVELSIYVDETCRKHGVGRLLYDGLSRTNISRRTASAFMSTWDMRSSAASGNADTNSTAGTAWSGWRRSSGIIWRTSRPCARSRRCVGCSGSDTPAHVRSCSEYMQSRLLTIT